MGRVLSSMVGVLMLLTCVASSGCLRESTGCVDDSECGAGLVCTGGACAIPPLADAGPGDAGRADGGQDAQGDADAGEGPRWEVLASDLLSFEISSTLRDDGSLVVGYAPTGREVFEVLTRRDDGALLAPSPVDRTSDDFVDLAVVSRAGADGVDLVFIDDMIDLVALRAGGSDVGAVEVLLPSGDGRYGVQENRVLASSGGGVVGVLVSLAETSPGSDSVVRAEWLDTASPGGASTVTLGEVDLDASSLSVGAVTVPRGDGHVAFWHVAPDTIEYAAIGADGRVGEVATLDEASARDLEGQDALGFRPAAYVDSQSTVWAAYLFGRVLVNSIRVRAVELDGDVLALPELDLGPFGGVLGMGMVASGGEVHVVYQEQDSRDQLDFRSELVHARHDGAGWTRTTLDPETGNADFVDVHMGEGGMHVVYTAFAPGQGSSGEVRYQWVAF